jgi:HSP20 family protein
MSQLVKFNTSPSLRSFLENFWSHDFMDDDVALKAKLPAVNVKDNDKNYEIEVAAPGLKKEDFNISVENRILTISAEHKEEKEMKDDKFTRREFMATSFNRSFSLPENVDDNNIQGHYEDGVLYVTVPKLEETKPPKKTIALS